MRFICGCTNVKQTIAAADQLTAEARDRLGGTADLVVAIMTHHHRDHAKQFLQTVREVLSPRCLIGCTAEGVISGPREHERVPALAILAGQMPDVAITPLRITGNDLNQKPAAAVLPDCGLDIRTPQTLILLPDPFSIPARPLLDAVNTSCRGWPVVGGMASGALQELDNVLLLNDEVYRHGAVGVALSGGLETHVVVSQGCRPIGEPYVITQAEQNVIRKLAGRSALECVQELVDGLSEDEREMVAQGLLIGRAITARKDNLDIGDFLIRNILGVDQSSGAIAVADYVRAGQTVQFHVRDADSADQELRRLLEAFEPGRRKTPPAAALLFSCNGRGTRMFPHTDHDSGTLAEMLGPVPLIGHFAAGEIGPLSGQTFLHGHTASIALLYPRP